MILIQDDEDDEAMVYCVNHIELCNNTERKRKRREGESYGVYVINVAQYKQT